MRWSMMCGALLLATPGAAATVPVPVSPASDLEMAVVESRCPTFSWGSVADARAYELIVYRLDDDGAPTDPELRRAFPGGVTSWTPTLESCLERGGRYAWAIRAATAEGSTPWSPATIFDIAELPGWISRREAVALAQRLLAAAPGSHEPAAGAEAGETPRDGSHTSSGGSLPAEAPAFDSSAGERDAVEPPPATLTVEGEVRGVGPDGKGRIWGLGGPGTIVHGTGSGLCENSGAGVFFGLSNRMVPWYGLRYACPFGTWVCQEADRLHTVCDTDREDDNQDGRGCDESWFDFAANNHKGWIHRPSGDYSGTTMYEQGNSGSSTVCSRLPVWCCSN
jgi:hypothetical protein